LSKSQNQQKRFIPLYQISFLSQP